MMNGLSKYNARLGNFWKFLDCFLEDGQNEAFSKSELTKVLAVMWMQLMLLLLVSSLTEDDIKILLCCFELPLPFGEKNA